MTEVNIRMLHPSLGAVTTQIRHTLRDLYGYVPPDISEDFAEHIHDVVTSFQRNLINEIKEAS